MRTRVNRQRIISIVLLVLGITGIILVGPFSIMQILRPVDMTPPGRPVEMLNTARKISEYSKTVMVGVVNDAYLPFAYSWLCNTKEMGIHKYILFITDDDETAKTLKRDWPEVSVASMGIKNLKGDRRFGSAGYLRVNTKRHQYIYELLKDGFELFHFEVDCVWLRNPLPYFQGHVGYDIIVNEVSHNGEYNNGFTYVFNTERSVEVWRQLAQKMTDLADRIAWLKDTSGVPDKNNDQPFWTDIIRHKIPGIKVKVLRLDSFADGKWYKLSDEEKRNVTNPYIINNNWIAGNSNKKARAKKWGHWFVDDNMKCNMDLVHKVVKET